MKRAPALAALALMAAAGEARAQLRGPLTAPLAEVFEQVRPAVTGPVDTRFFGIYCQPEPKEFCKSVPILPDPCVTLRNFTLHLDHITTPTGGLLNGGGTFVLDGDQGALAVAGAVLGRLPLFPSLSVARFSGVAPGLGRMKGFATLSSSGIVLTAHVEGRKVTLRKDACGNAAPAVTLIAPFGPSFPFGQSVMLAAQITDEDTSFPDERLVFTSDRQGVLSGTRTAGGRTMFISALVPGNHRITVRVTDSNGLTGQASLDLTILNRPPETPRIFLPAEGATLVAQAPVLLQGQALDPDSGFLTGGFLQWSAQLTPGGPFVPLGVGTELGATFATPADPVTIRLKATDNTGLTSQTERQVRVIPSTGNAPPVVVIRQPDRVSVTGSPLVATFFGGQTAHFLADAFDVEDAPADLDLKWELVALTGLGGTPDPAPAFPNPAPVTGSLAADVFFPLGSSTFYRVTFTATDQGGATSTDTIEIFVNQGIIL